MIIFSNKYYTPKIEEFCVGFEFEIKDGENWLKDKLTEENICKFFFLYFSSFYNTKYRVKYLDKEDVESFGFVHVKADKYTQTIKGSLFYRVTHLYLRNGCSIYKSMVAIHKDGNNSYGVVAKYDDEFHKRIEIKNKYELNKYLQQLDLIQKEI